MYVLVNIIYWIYLCQVNNEASGQVSSLISATLLHQPAEVSEEDDHPAEFKRVTFMFNQQRDTTPSVSLWFLFKAKNRAKLIDAKSSKGFIHFKHILWGFIRVLVADWLIHVIWLSKKTIEVFLFVKWWEILHRTLH